MHFNRLKIDIKAQRRLHISGNSLPSPILCALQYVQAQNLQLLLNAVPHVMMWESEY